MTDEIIFKVSEFNEFISAYLGKVGEVVVEGEISEIRVNQGKWLFATIKDEEASVEVFAFAPRISGYDVLEAGMLVHIYGIPRLYKKTGRFSIHANQIVPAGEGALRIAFEKLKVKLEKEGLFDVERKRPLPVFPEKIALITAKGSKAYSDFLKVLKHRMGGLKIYFYPVSVQGRNSVETILAAFEYLNKNPQDFDLIVLTRGGGSLEDLQSFNDEKVARAIFSNKIPVVCAVGHEDDFSIADHVADVRASTASNAAELIVRDRTEVLKEVNYCIKTIERRLKYLLGERNQAVLDKVNVLKNTINRQVLILHQTINKFGAQFTLFTNKVALLGQEATKANRILGKAVDLWLKQKRTFLESLTRLLKSLDLRQVLKRGFSVTVDESGVVIKSTKKVSKGQKITTTLYDGKIGSQVLRVEKS